MTIAFICDFPACGLNTAKHGQSWMTVEGKWHVLCDYHADEHVVLQFLKRPWCDVCNRQPSDPGCEVLDDHGIILQNRCKECRDRAAETEEAENATY